MRERHWRYYVVGFVIALVLFSALVWGPSLPFFAVLFSTGPSLAEGLRALFTILELGLPDQSPALLGFYALLAALTGANVALLLLYWRTRRLATSGGAATSGALGALVAALGFGCASCGTLFLSIVLGSVGGISLAAVPAIDEITYALRALGLVLLAFSLFRLIRHLNDPLTCPVS